MEDALFLTEEIQNSWFFIPPLEYADLARALKKAIAYARSCGKGFVMRSCDDMYRQRMEDAMPGAFIFTEDTAFFDYIYDVKELIQLSGKKFHGKRNHLNRFKADYPDAAFRLLTSRDLDACLYLFDEWSAKRGAAMPEERLMITEAVRGLDLLGFEGGAIELDGRFIAYTLAERTIDDTCIIHIEKADPDINGAYAAINQMFLENVMSDMTWVNREEDVGIEGLRRAKRSYNPKRMLKKYIVRHADA